MPRKVNRKSTKEDKNTNLKFKSFYTSYMLRIKKNDDAQYYKDHKADYKEAFTIIENHKESYFAFNYLVAALDHLNNYLAGNIALPFEDKMLETSVKWTNLLKKVKDSLIFSLEINQIMSILIREYNRKVFKGEKGNEITTEYSKDKIALLKETHFLSKTIDINRRKNKKETINLVLENYSVNDKDKYFYYLQSDHDFMNKMKFLVFHMNLFNKNSSKNSMSTLIKEVALDIQLIVDQLFYEGISRSEVSKNESIELIDKYSSINTSIAS